MFKGTQQLGQVVGGQDMIDGWFKYFGDRYGEER